MFIEGVGVQNVGTMNKNSPLPGLFTQTLTGLQVPAERHDALWKKLYSTYTARGRHYHHLNHLTIMVKVTRQTNLKLDDPDLYYFALFYHDFVYNPLRQDNEERSADRAVKILEEAGVDPARVTRCRAMIEQTKTHRLTPAADGPTDALLLDVDLAVLGIEWRDYEVYTKMIRQEYRLVPDLLYRPGRAKVLRSFLERSHIYLTPHFRSTSEARARENLTRELALL